MVLDLAGQRAGQREAGAEAVAVARVRALELGDRREAVHGAWSSPGSYSWSRSWRSGVANGRTFDVAVAHTIWSSMPTY